MQSCIGIPKNRDRFIFNYTPPALGSTQTATIYSYNLDKQLTQIARPDGKTIDVTYDNGGRRNQVILPRGTMGYAYNAAGQVSTITDPDNGQLTYTYDGFLPLTETLTGQVNGSIGRTYDNFFRVTQLNVNGSLFTFGYDNDGYLTQAGQLTLTRDPANGFLTGTTLGGVTTTQAYNAFAEMTAFTANDGTSDVYQVSYTHDAIGRITQKVETIAGTTTTYDYGYDVAGRLTTVQQNGITVSTYSYDANGNRLSHNGTSGSYDAQDRLLTYGAASYSYTLNGELTSKTQAGVTTNYTYDTLGNLTQAVLPGSVTVDYVIDGRNLRVGKKINGQLTQGFIYQDQLNPVAELDGTGAVVATFIYGSRINVPDYMDKGGNTYRIISDHLGSPRLVINTQDGSIAQRIDYDEFGNIINDTNPGFQPFGFAGGIYDQHTGFTRFGARDYDANIGRWTSKDPIGFVAGDTNLYGYVVNDPINWLDPTGLFSITDPTTWPTIPTSVEAAAVGFGDGAFKGITLGIGDLKDVREYFGINDSVNKCSDIYKGFNLAGKITGGGALGGALGKKLLELAKSDSTKAHILAAALRLGAKGMDGPAGGSQGSSGWGKVPPASGRPPITRKF